jgi:acyl-CoA synthetase (AMP-forming)/AMP-acid ligase II
MYPNGLLGYSFTWSPAGVINEYINDAEVIHNGVIKMVPSLDGLEHINIEGRDYEAFSTSGGLGTMCETYEGKVDTLNYKTIRYPGHAKLMRFLLYELILKEKRELVEEILTEAKPPVAEDVVIVYAVVEGWKKEGLAREEYYRSFHPIEVDGKKFFRSGDLGYRDDEGFFFFTDRLKRMINASGYKVWPAEVEAMMYKHTDIQECCIIATQDDYRGETVKAVVVKKPGSDISGESLMEWARTQMAAYKVPRVVSFVDVLTKSATGKVMWRQLQEAERTP